MIQRVLARVTLGLALGLGPVAQAWPQAAPPAWTDQFPVELEHWKAQQVPLVQGITEADQLRRRLLTRTPQGETYAARLARVVQAFQRELVTGRLPLVSVAEFQMSPARLESQLRSGVSVEPAEVFRAFDGRWFGLWDVWPVNHDWRPSTIYQPPQQFAPHQLPLLATQYAWIGNGFGWNYLAEVDAARHQAVVLGQVYYFSDQDYTKIQDRKPHVGYVDVPDTGPQQPAAKTVRRLVWITEREVFLEEVFPQADPAQTYYVITGLYHGLLSEPPSVSSQAVQARYTRRWDERPPFQHVEWHPPAD